MLALPELDELYVVSDIHMGGAPGFQILREGPRLGKLITKLATTRPGERVGLVLNGDVIDSLAEDIDGYIAMDDADRMMARLYVDPMRSSRRPRPWSTRNTRHGRSIRSSTPCAATSRAGERPPRPATASESGWYGPSAGE